MNINNFNKFDWISYVLKYEDLQKARINTKGKAYKHWITYGKKENRNTKTNKIFDWKLYISNNDLQKMGINTEDKAFQHYITHYKKKDQVFIKYINNQNLDNQDLNNQGSNDSLNIYYYVESTSTLPVNTGIQRVVRLLGKYLDNKCNFYLIKFDRNISKFVNITIKEREHLEKFNGIPVKFKPLNFNVENKWLFNAEICFDLPSLKPIFDEARRNDMKIAIIYYDDIQYKLSELWPANTRELYKSFIYQLIESDIIFPISHYSYNRLMFHIIKNKIKVNNNKIIKCILPGEFPEINRNFNFDVHTVDNKYRILCIGAISVRKNQIPLLQAINLLQNKYNIELILVGSLYKQNKYARDALNLIKSNKNIIHYNNIDDEKLKELYLSSYLTVFPSIEEGFGLPILESIWNCRPCICMNEGAMNEVAIAGCLKVNCRDSIQIAEAIEKIISDDNIRNNLINEIKNIKIKTWEEYTDEIINYLSSFNNRL